MGRQKSRFRRLTVERLESRSLLAIDVSVNTAGDRADADPGDGVCDVDATLAGNQCTLTAAAGLLNLNGGGTLQLTLSGEFPPVEFTQPIAFDGQDNWMQMPANQPLRLNGGSIRNLTIFGELEFRGHDGLMDNLGVADSLGLLVVGDRNTIQNSVFVRGRWAPSSENSGILTIRGSHNRVDDNWIGVYDDLVFNNGNNGIAIDGTNVPATHNFIVNNTISGSDGDAGVLIVGEQAAFNRLEGNKIGTNVAGTEANKNYIGVHVIGARDTTIGGDGGGSNVISGNHQGIVIQGPAPRTLVAGNWIGLTADDAPLGNDLEGIGIYSSTGERDDITIQGNVISANGTDGVFIESSGVTVLNNLIGTDSTGMLPRGNEENGVHVSVDWLNPENAERGSYNVIGTSAYSNVISANGRDGVQISGGTDNTVSNNLIGLANDGNTPLGNAGTGVSVGGGWRNSIGTIGAGNIVSGNLYTGIYLGAGGDNSVLANTIGLNQAGTAAVPNQGSGIQVGQGSGNRIGALTPESGNIISGNTWDGLDINLQASQTTVLNNIVGTNLTNLPGLGNGSDGIKVYDGHQSVIGLPGAGNIVAGNGGIGISLIISDENQIQSNRVGLDAIGNPLGNALGGIELSHSSLNKIGGTAPDERNYVSANGPFGMFIGQTSADNHVYNNYIGPLIDGMSAPAGTRQDIGILMEYGAARNLIGTDGVRGAGNLISGNREHGIFARFGYYSSMGIRENTFGGNTIGLNATRDGVLSNGGDGIRLTDGAADNVIGGGRAGAANVIAGNLGNGITFQNASSNQVQSNSIGVAPGNDQVFGNHGSGVFLNDSYWNLIGSVEPSMGNTIRGNLGTGITAQSPHYFFFSGNQLLGNRIYENVQEGLRIVASESENDRVAVIRRVERSGNQLSATVRLHSLPFASVRLELFANREADPTGFGEGELPVASLLIDIPSTGFAETTVAFLVPDESFDFVTATLTSDEGITSGFSRGVSQLHQASSMQPLVLAGPSNDWDPLQIVATLASPVGVPSGEVKFYDEYSYLGSATLDESGVARLSLTRRASNMRVTAVYEGSDEHSGTISSTPFSVFVAPVRPIANPDLVVAIEDGSFAALADVLANDYSADGGTLLPATVTIVQPPAHGVATIDATLGRITYVPDINYSGADELQYTVADDHGHVSYSVPVTIVVVETSEPYHNLLNPMDVNKSGYVEPLDALLIVNYLNEFGSQVLPAPTTAPALFYDVNGDNAVSPLDALMVINFMNERGFSEPPAIDPMTVATAWYFNVASGSVGGTKTRNLSDPQPL